MKSLLIAGAAFTAAALGVAPALAQSVPYLGQMQAYGTLGYANLNGNGVDLSAVQGRIGARFGRYFGIEAEYAGGTNFDHTTDSFGTPLKVGLRNQEAVYGVGFLPLTPRLDLFARGGFGGTDAKLGDYALPTRYRFGDESWNYGAGAQYFFAGPNGVRVDYTKYDYEHDQPNEDVWSVAFVRKF
jgi:hypothetical protein